jgi:eukaryotic-like serine/threonine-protein kinase
MIGQTLLHYRIVRHLGQGGMGVVYLARDQKLRREVALKFLPPQFADQPEERARLLQEARAASALNHPNLCVIHAIEDAGDQPFIVMEYVAGETLRARLARGPLAAGEAIAWAIQIGEGLVEAHHRALVHRDIKSDNIMITPAGRAKLMDFGLARIRDAGSPSHTATTSGTLAYMAPEQFRDGAIDARSDLYSFGVVLYEMLAGRAPFDAESPAATMYAVLNTEPEPLQSVRPGLPSDLQHVLDRALEKDPADRYQSMDDVLIELRRVQRQLARPPAAPTLHVPAPPPGAGTAAGPATPQAIAAVPGASPAPAHPSRHDPRRGLVVAVFGAVALVVAVALMHNRAPRLNPRMTFRTLPLPVSSIGYPGMSQDGGWIAFPAADERGRWGVYFMNVNGTEVRPITVDSTGGRIVYADVSPDGSQIAYVDATGPASSELRVVSSLGGPSTRIAESASGPHWTPDGRRVGYQVTQPRSSSHHLELWSVAADGSDARREYVDTVSSTGRISFSWSPDAKRVAWIRTFPNATQELLEIPLSGGHERQITHDHANIDEVCWTRHNDLVFSSNRAGNSNLWIVRASGGPAVQVTKGAGPDIGMRISADGRHLLYLQSQPSRRLFITSVDHPDARPLLGPDVTIGTLSVSHGGRDIAVSVQNPDPLKEGSRLEVIARDGGERRVVAERMAFEQVGWSPDDRQVAYAAHPATAVRDSSWVWVSDAEGAAPPRRLCPGVAFAWNHPDSMFVLAGARGHVVDVRTGGVRDIPGDSTVAVPLGAGRTLIVDLRHGPPMFAVRDAAGAVHALGGPGAFRGASPGFEWGLIEQPNGELARIRLTDFQLTPVQRPPGFGPSSAVSLTSDGRTLLYTVERSLSKLVMIDDLR